MLSFKEFLLLEGTSFDAKLASMKNKHGELVQEYFDKIEPLVKQQDNVLWFLQFLEQNLESLKEVDDLIVQFKDHYKDYLDKVHFKGKTKDQVLTALENLYNKDKAKEDKNKGIEPQAFDEILIKCASGNSWWFVDRAFCSEEARSGNHCGNVVGKEKTDQRIISLRNSSNQVILTFILEPDNTLGEMKAKGNLKPAKDYHADIMELLVHKPFTLTKGSEKANFQISGISGKGYLPHMNFSIFDLSEEDIMKIHEHNKKFITDQISINPIEILGTSDKIKELYKGSVKPYINKLIKNPSLDNWKNAIDKDPEIIIYTPQQYWSQIESFEKNLINQLVSSEDLLLKAPPIISKNFDILKQVIERDIDKLKLIQPSYKDYNKLVAIAIYKSPYSLRMDEVKSEHITQELAEHILLKVPKFAGKVPTKYIPDNFHYPLSIDGNLQFPNNTVSSLLKLCPRSISGKFYCIQNSELTSLEGCPKKVGGDFMIEFNSLTNLKYSPKEVGGTYNCSYNKLTTLEGCSQIIGMHFECAKNQLTNLKYGPKKVRGDYYCMENNLTSLEGCPENVNNNFSCSKNQLTNLKFGPKRINGNYICTNNNLTSLEGSPEVIGSGKKVILFSCDDNQLETLEGMPKEIHGHFYCRNNKKKFTEDYVRKLSKVHGDVFC